MQVLMTTQVSDACSGILPKQMELVIGQQLGVFLQDKRTIQCPVTATMPPTLQSLWYGKILSTLL